jgi:hypothetical protein
VRGLVGVAITLVMLSLSCQSTPQPVEEYTLARAAMDAARAVQAPRHSPGYWHQADEAYRQGRLFFKDRDFSKAREAFLRAKLAAEKAENSARLIRQKTGDVL